MEKQEAVQHSSASSTRTVARPTTDDLNEKEKQIDQEKQESKPNLAADVEAAVEGAQVLQAEHPDGGLKAWSVVFGASTTPAFASLVR